jgi:hypothetical protein
VLLAVGLVLAAASSAALNWGFFAQHEAAVNVPSLSLRRPFRSLWSLLSNFHWMAGFAVGIGGWALYITALVLAPLSLVQATSAGGIGLLAFLVSRSRRAAPSKPSGGEGVALETGMALEASERAGVGLAFTGLLLLGVSVWGSPATTGRGGVGPVAAWVAASGCVAAAALGPGRRLLAAGSGHGIAAGLLYGAGDVATKAAVGGGTRLVFVPVVAACHGAAFVVLQLGFQRGDALATAGLSTLLTDALPIAAGFVLFQETLPPGAQGIVRIVAFVAVVAAAAILARRPRGSVPEMARAQRPSLATGLCP